MEPRLPMPHTLGSLAVQLRDGTTEERVAAAEALCVYGADAVEPLCEALGQREPKVRAAAAESLGHIGDERAIGPLTEALRRCFLGRRPWIQTVGGIVVCLLTGASWQFSLPASGLTILPLWLHFSIFVGVMLAVGGISGAYDDQRRAQIIVIDALTEALDRLGDGHAAPSLGSAAPVLRGMRFDWLYLNRRTRRDAARVAAKLERVVEETRELPIAAVAPIVALEALPLPSSGMRATGEAGDATEE